MQTALRVTTRVLPGHRVEIVDPELPDGESVDVFVVMASPKSDTPSVTAVLPSAEESAKD